MADRLSPTFIKVGPNGEITYEFEGHVVATGVDLPADTTGAPIDDNRIRWIREADGVVVAEQYAVDTPAGSGLTIRNYKRDGAAASPSRVALQAMADDAVSGFDGYATFTVEVNRNAAGPVEAEALLDLNGVRQARILDELGRSDFVQVAGGGFGAHRQINRGAATVTFPGGSPFSVPANIAHGLTDAAGAGIVPASFVVSCARVLPGATHYCLGIYTALATPNISVAAYSVTGSPTAGNTAEISWTATS